MFFQPSHVNSGNSPNSPPKSPLMAQTLRRSVSILSTLRHVAPLCNRPVQRQHYFSPFSLSDNKLCLRNVCAPHSSASFATAVCEPRHVSGFRFAKKKTVVFNRGQDFIQRQLWIQQAPFSSAHRGHAGSNMDAINELNDELDFVFGSTLPPTSLSEPPTSLRETQHSHSVPESGSDSPSPTEQPPMPLFTPPSFAPTTESTHKLTHVDRKGKASMVDVSDKANTNRVAVATGRVLLGPKAFEMVKANEIAKGDVLTVAQIAGIQGAKSTSTLIPLCHNILLSQVDVALHLREQSHSVEIEARARTVGTTGVEMEALTAVTVAALTVYDMCKAVSKEIEIQNICLKHKSGGKSGDWHRVESGISRNKLDPKEGELSQLNDGFGDLREDSSWEPQFGHAR